MEVVRVRLVVEVEGNFMAFVGGIGGAVVLFAIIGWLMLRKAGAV